MYEQLEKTAARYQELEQLLGSQKQIADRKLYNKLAKELSDIRPVVSLYREYKNLLQETSDLEIVMSAKHDHDFMELAQAELKVLAEKKSALEQKLDKILAGENKDAGRDCIVEIRQGTGGDEAGLFAAVLYRMYSKYADNKGWVIEPMYSSVNEAGGIKEIVFSVKGKDSFRCLKFESGVHRVQRVPTT
ncbi:MAG: peptide chain release factor 1, partial [Candidatus Omnitrophica bacterium CG11_big_fil_rev_8_21_14_0_20_43_6]